MQTASINIEPRAGCRERQISCPPAGRSRVFKAVLRALVNLGHNVGITLVSETVQRGSEEGLRSSSAVQAKGGLTPCQLCVERQWLAVLMLDIAGYSHLIEVDDLRTALRVLWLRKQLVEPIVVIYSGRV